MSIGRQIVANYAGTAVSVIVPVVALPFYLKALGAQQWGLMGVAVTLIGLLSILDPGVHLTLVREFATRAGGEQRHEISVLLARFARLYWIFSFAMGLAVSLAANVIVTYWLKPGDLDPELCTKTILAAAILFFVQFPGLLYSIVLIGTGRQVQHNAVLIPATIARHLGGCIIVAFEPSILALLGWHILISASETAIRGVMAWRIAGRKVSSDAPHNDAMRRVFISAAHMSGAALVGVLVTHIDRVLLSGLVPVESFGYYAVASNISLVLLNLIYPITTAALPRMAALRERPAELRRFNFAVFFAILIILAGTALIVSVAGPRLLVLWLRDAHYAAQVWTPLALLLIGTALNALYAVGHSNWIARGSIRPVFLVNLFSLLLAIAAIPPLVSAYGIRGAAIGWIVVNAFGLVSSSGWIFRSRAT